MQKSHFVWSLHIFCCVHTMCDMFMYVVLLVLNFPLKLKLFFPLLVYLNLNWGKK